MSENSTATKPASNDLETAKILAERGVIEMSPEEIRRSELRPLRAVRLSDVEAEPIDWLWNPFLALGTFNILEGEEGIGKTFLICALASAIASGQGLPMVGEAAHIEPSNVLLISAEDSLSQVLKPRLTSMDAPCERIIAIDEPFTLNDDGVFRLSQSIAEYEPKLVVIDPIFSYTGKVNLDRDNEIRSVTDALKRLAEKHHCSIVGIRHIGKSKGLGDARNAGLNGVGWRASARSVLLIGKNPENERQKALCQTKNNLAARFEKSIGFEIEGSQFFWTGESSLTAAAMLAAMRTETGDEKSDKQDASAFLREILRPGEQLSNDVLAEARQCGIAERTLHRAKKELNIHSRKEGFGKSAKWFWTLPEDYQADAEDCQINNVGNLRANDANKTLYSNDLPEGCQNNITGNLSGNVGNLRADGKTCDKCGAPVQNFTERCRKCGELPTDI